MNIHTKINHLLPYWLLFLTLLLLTPSLQATQLPDDQKIPSPQKDDKTQEVKLTLVNHMFIKQRKNILARLRIKQNDKVIQEAIKNGFLNQPMDSQKTYSEKKNHCNRVLHVIAYYANIEQYRKLCKKELQLRNDPKNKNKEIKIMDFEPRNAYEFTPILLTAWKGKSPNLFDLLIEHYLDREEEIATKKAEKNQPNSNQTKTNKQTKPTREQIRKRQLKRWKTARSYLETLKDNQGQTALLLAASNDKDGTMVDHILKKYLLSQKKDLKDKNGPYTIEEPRKYHGINKLQEQQREIKEILEGQKSNDGKNVLLTACFYNQKKTIKKLLAYHKNPIEYLKTTDNHGKNAILQIVITGDLKLFKNINEKYNMITKDKNNLTGRYALLLAACNGHIPIVDHLVKTYDESYGVDLKYRDKHGMDVLFLASWGGHIPMVQHLLKNYPKNFTITFRYKKTGMDLFLYAACNNKLTMIKFLVKEHNFNPRDLKNQYGKDLFLLACLNNGIETVKYALDQCGVNINAINAQGLNGLLCAARNGNEELLDLLVKTYKMSDLNSLDNKGNNAILCSAWNGKEKMVKKLTLPPYYMNVGFTNNFGMNVALCAAYNGKNHMLAQALLPITKGGYGMSPFTKDIHGKGILLCPAYNGKISTIIFVLKKYKQTLYPKHHNITEKEILLSRRDTYGKNTLLCAIFSGLNHVIDWLATPKEKGGSGYDIQPNHSKNKNYIEYDCILTAVSSGQIHTLIHLRDTYGIPLDKSKDQNGRTATLIAAFSGESKTYDWLIQQLGKSHLKDTDNMGANALICACLSGKIKMIDHLLSPYTKEEQQKLLSYKDERGYEAILAAAEVNRWNVVHHLYIKYGRSLDTRSEIGENILYLAMYNASHQIAKQLIENYNCKKYINERCGYKNMTCLDHLHDRMAYGLLTPEKYDKFSKTWDYLIKHGAVLYYYNGLLSSLYHTVTFQQETFEKPAPPKTSRTQPKQYDKNKQTHTRLQQNTTETDTDDLKSDTP